jgi:calcineurin-like phosphoesterase family protein
MTVFFTSDLHLAHRKVAQIRWQRAFPDIELPPEPLVLRWHDQLLAQNWDATVAHDDVVWVLGDLALSATQTGINTVLQWVLDRPGRKHLIPGNHDPVHPLHRQAHKWQKTYTNWAFESVQLAARRKVTTPTGTHEVLLSHMPYTGDRNQIDRDTQWRLKDEGRWLLHGHLHGADPRSGPRQIDVGLDAWNLTPVSLDQVAAVMG